MTDQYHRDTKHYFNVIFNEPNRDGLTELETTHTFTIYPIYWTVMVIPGDGYIKGKIKFRPKGYDLISGSGYILVNTSTSAVPKMSYSGSLIANGFTTTTGSNSVNTKNIIF